MQFRAAVFDLDGTLVNSLGDICAAVNRLRRELGLPQHPHPTIQASIGKGVDHLISQTISEAPPEHLSTLIDRYRDLYIDSPDNGSGPYPGVIDGLLQLRGLPGVKLAIATNKSTSVAEKTVKAYLPQIEFDYLAGPERVSKKKPAKEHLLEVLSKIQVDPHEAVFVGDDPVDRECAGAAGVRYFAAGYGFGGVKADPEQTLREFSDLLIKLGVSRS